jgi:TonB family protein
MDITLRELESESKHKKRARIISIVLHVSLLLLVIFLVPKTPPPPQGNEGVTIAFGDPNAGGGYEEPTPPTETEEVVEEVTEESPAPAPTPTPDSKPDVKTADSDEVAIKKQKEAPKKAKKAEKAEEAEEEAKEKAAAQAKALEEKKRKAGKKFNSGSGDGDKPGDIGDPDSDKPGGGTGEGTTGSGADISGRSVKSKPKRLRNPGVNGTVVITICVNPKGSVTSAEYTQKGSTITSDEAIREAISNAKEWKFNENPMAGDKECGKITYKFEVK